MEQTQLRRCYQCGRMKGKALVDDRREEPVYLPVLCLCDGIVCRHCGEGAIYRPISNRYDERSGSVGHVPYFGYLAPCAACRLRNRA